MKLNILNKALKRVPEDPAFSTGGRPIFKFKKIYIGSTCPINQSTNPILNPVLH